MSQDEPFLKRWSRLKRSTRSTSVQSPQADAASADESDEPRTSAASTAEPGSGEHGSTSPPPECAHDGAESFDLAELPRLEDLTADSDIRRFLDARVPAVLRDAALRRMWSLDPTIRDFIEVAENQWNWNVPGGAPGYGPLAQGTDIAALVAQATGRMIKSPEELNNEASFDSASPDADIASQQSAYQPTSQAVPHPGPIPGQDVGSGQIAETPIEPNRNGALQHDFDREDEPASAVARRHGSALPS